MQENNDSQISIMIIDDSIIDQKINTKIIYHSALFKNVINCYSVDIAFQYLKLNLKHADNIPDIILLDIQMPEKDGFTFLADYKKLIIESTKHPKIIILSSSLDTSDILKANTDENVIGFLTKPLDFNAFVETITRYFKL